jgi:phosphate acetyltransferase
MAPINAQLLSGDPVLLSREVTGLVVAGMTMPNVLDRLFDGAAVVTAADRPEVVLGVLMAHASLNFPQISTVILNGGFTLPPQVQRLIDGLGVTLPILETTLDTQSTSTALTAVRGRLTKESPRKLDAALALFDRNVDSEALLDQLAVSRSSAVTPLMFEHQLIDQAVAHRKHIVLPEGDEERIRSRSARRRHPSVSTSPRPRSSIPSTTTSVTGWRRSCTGSGSIAASTWTGPGSWSGTSRTSAP